MSVLDGTENLLADAVEKELAGFYLALARAHQFPSGMERYFSWVKNTTGWPSFVFSLHFPQTVMMQYLEDMVRRIRSEDLPSHAIVSDHLGEDLLNAMVKLRFTPVQSWVGMWCAKENILSPVELPEISLKEVQNSETAGHFVSLVNEILLRDKKMIPEIVLTSGKSGLYFYTACLKEIPTGTIALHTHGSAAGIYLVTVRPEYRNKGLGTWITFLAIRQAIEMGCHTFILHASRLGEPVYRKLGFRPVSRLYILTCQSE